MEFHIITPRGMACIGSSEDGRTVVISTQPLKFDVPEADVERMQNDGAGPEVEQDLDVATV